MKKGISPEATILLLFGVGLMAVITLPVVLLSAEEIVNYQAPIEITIPTPEDVITENVTNPYGYWSGGGVCSPANYSDHQEGDWSIGCDGGGSVSYMRFNFNENTDLTNYETYDLWVKAHNIDNVIVLEIYDNASNKLEHNLTYDVDYSQDLWNFTTSNLEDFEGSIDLENVVQLGFRQRSGLSGQTLRLDGLLLTGSGLAPRGEGADTMTILMGIVVTIFFVFLIKWYIENR
jgi:hypothetical protein